MENKTGKYFKYAIGEIVLVVIGILIALSINNWNEIRKNNSKKDSLIHAVIEDLKKDTLAINNGINIFKRLLAENEILQSRMYAADVNLDTLKQIGFYDFNPFFWGTIEQFNDVTFNSMQSTGSIELFPKETKGIIVQHYAALQNLKNDNADFYFRKIGDYSSIYPFVLKPGERENFTTLIHKNITDTDNFVSLLTDMINYKNHMIEGYIQQYESLKTTTTDLIIKLNENIE